MSILDNYRRLRGAIPQHVDVVVAAKTRTPSEIREVIDAGANILGENYVQEAQRAYKGLEEAAGTVNWHMIGHLQRNKVKDVIDIFDMIETVDSIRLAREIDKRCCGVGKIMQVLLEINSGKEPQKAGMMPEDTVILAREISVLPNIRIVGLMTMGPFTGNPEDARPYFVETRKLFDEIKGLGLPGVEMKHLSMGMTNSYEVAIEEGSNMVRLGTAIFGEREKCKIQMSKPEC
jgi:pyridoxal phosphate enzyme (YggS family)